MNKIVMAVGNIGSGKSTYFNHLDKKGLCMEKDNLREVIAETVGLQYIHTDPIEEIVHSMTMDMLEALMIVGNKVIYIDETLMSVKARACYIALAKKYEYRVEVVLFEDRGCDAHVDSRMTNPRGETRMYWDRIYLMLKETYEPPTFMEGIDDVTTYSWEI